MDMWLSEIAACLQGQLIGADARVIGVAINSQKINASELFFAIPGARVDPHGFLPDVLTKHAAGAVVERAMPCAIPQIVVKNSYAALGQLATYWRKRHPIPLIAVTGSNGKTTTKNMITQILIAHTGSESAVLSSQGNLNSGYGLPLTLCRLNASHTCGVVEMGMSTPGEIDYISRMAKPAVAVITNVFPCHVAGLGSLDAIAKAKAEIFHGLDGNGIAIVNADDAYASYWLTQLRAQPRRLFSLQDNQADVYASDIRSTHAPAFRLHTAQGSLDVQLQLLGLHNVRNALAAAAACEAMGVHLTAIREGLEGATSVAGRLHTHHLPRNITLIDDAYNANPGSMHAAIDILANHSGARYLIAGDMRELGEEFLRYHRELGVYAKARGIHVFYGIGEAMQEAVVAFGDGARHFDNQEILLEALYALPEHSVLLVKGSLSMRMQAIVSAFLSYTQKTECSN